MPIAVAALSIAASCVVSAVPALRASYGNAGANCQPALPAFSRVLRLRPLGVQNEGSDDAFVTCAMTSQGQPEPSATNPVAVIGWFGTVAPGTTSIDCTAVTGAQGGPNTYAVKSIVVVPGGGSVPIVWRAEDFGATGTLPSGLVGLSCRLPPGASMLDQRVSYAEDIAG